MQKTVRLSFGLEGDPTSEVKANRRFQRHVVPGMVYLAALGQTLDDHLSGVDADSATVFFIACMIDRLAPRDGLEEMLIVQLALTHARVLRLTALSGHQSETRAIETINGFADRASNTFRKLLEAYDQRREGRSGSRVTQIGQANFAQQQIVQNGVDRDTRPRNEQGSRPSAPATDVPAEPRGVGRTPCLFEA